MKIEHVKISDLKMAGYNPRQMSNDMMAALVNSIRKFGCLEPIVVNKKDNTVIGGHQRIIACKQLAMEKVPVVYSKTPLNKRDEKTLNLGFNKITGYFVDQKLVPVLEELKLDSDDDLSLTGFSEIEIKQLIDPIHSLNGEAIKKSMGKGYSEYIKGVNAHKLINRLFCIFQKPVNKLALDLFAGEGNLSNIYSVIFKKVVRNDKNEFENLDFMESADKFIQVHLPDFLDFDFIDFDDEGCPNSEILNFFQAIKAKKKNPFILCLTDGSGFSLKVNKTQLKRYALDYTPKTRFKDWELIEKRYIQGCAKSSEFKAELIHSVKGGQSDQILYQGYYVIPNNCNP